MRVISMKKLRAFWQSPGNAAAEEPLRAWRQIVSDADWHSFGDVPGTFNTADLESGGRKVIFEIGGNKYRLIAVIDYQRHKVFVWFVLTHRDYDKGNWKKDTFGANWDKPGKRSPREGTPGKRPRRKRK